MVERAAEKRGVNLRGTMIFTRSIILLAKAAFFHEISIMPYQRKIGAKAEGATASWWSGRLRKEAST